MVHPVSIDTTPHGTLAVDVVVNGPVQTNTYFVVSGDEAIVIDPAWDGEALARHFSDRRPEVALRAIVCTHCHGDHVGGVTGLRRALGDSIPYMISAADAPLVEQSIDRMRQRWGFDTELPPAPDRLLVEGDVVEVGDVRLQVLSTPGHTPGGIVLFAATETENVAFVGDTLFPGSHGRTDFEEGDDHAIIVSLGKLGRLLPPDTVCYVGHDGHTTIGRELEQNPFMKFALRHDA